jgi:hypothetical protein
MLRGGIGHHIPRGVDGQRSNAAGSDVEADYNAHLDLASDCGNSIAILCTRFDGINRGRARALSVGQA